MEILEQKQVSQCVGHTCDGCGKECDNDEHATFEAVWGYWSNQDGQLWNCDLCGSCAEKVKAFIEETLKGKVTVTE